MKIYNYHPETGVYLGASEADKSPLEKGKFLIPAHATKLKPLQEKAGTVSIFDGKKWSQVPLEAEHTEVALPEPTTEEQTALAKAKRNALLKASDWTQLQDVVLSEEKATAWRVYRQTLRDITAQVEFPNAISWPQKPE